jgi:hypothetical protein
MPDRSQCGDVSSIKKGRQMFLLRAAFWLTLVVLFIPGDPQTGAEAPRVGALQALDAAQATVADLSSFCDRNPDVCVTGSAAFRVFSEKAQNGVRILRGYLESPGEKSAPNRDASGTLEKGDRNPPWQQPRHPGNA